MAHRAKTWGLLHTISVALHFAWWDTKARYRRSVIGPFWIVLTTAIGVVGLGILWSALLKTDRATLIPSLTVGLVLWQTISSTITEAPAMFVRHSSLVRNIHINVIFFPVHLVLRHLINLLHNGLVVAVVLVIYPPNAPLSVQLLAIPGLMLLTVNLLWIATVIGMLGARFRDIEQLIMAVMPLAFFLTPVIYRPDHLPIDAFVVWLNPFTYLIALVRDPLQGHVPSLQIYAVTLVMALVGWLAALTLLRKRGMRIPFWV